MNTDTKRHIDAARQVLVGVVPNPTSQIDQITYALIYKFMDDMDQAAIKNGDEPAFFIGDLKQYSWARLMDTRLGNQERMNLYVVAFQKFAESKQLPELFRNILKSAFLPYRSPETLGLFLKEIDYFDYSHPEELGNAYEYLLSIMSSQGDAGQFRTPRHIIDFIVDVINPTVDDKVLDPACGTGGFLISSYKHILEQHDGIDDPEKKEKPLTPDQRRNLMNNFEGYDIDPGMVRIAQVNMYLHQFKNPKIFQYDTLSNEERWNDKFDVVMANPPFMSPQGGIRPHNKFGIQSTRSEVLFVDYIMNHLRPKGRAGIIVPEGIIFQSGSSHKQLRKNLVEDGLFAVVSLPSGVFNPYAGVKTSILLFDNEIAKQRTEMLFIKVESDGFDLGAQRRASSKNDLPQALEILNKWKTGEKVESKLALYVEKSKIAENGDYNLSSERYRVATDYSNVKWPMVKLGEITDKITKGTTPTTNGFEFQENGVNFIKIESIDESGYFIKEKFAHINQECNESLKRSQLKTGDVLFSIAGALGRVALVTDSILPANTNQALAIISPQKELDSKYLEQVLRSELIQGQIHGLKVGVAQNNLSLGQVSNFGIPLPPLAIQKQIVAELDNLEEEIKFNEKETKSLKLIQNKIISDRNKIDDNVMSIPFMDKVEINSELRSIATLLNHMQNNGADSLFIYFFENAILSLREVAYLIEKYFSDKLDNIAKDKIRQITKVRNAICHRSSPLNYLSIEKQIKFTRNIAKGKCNLINMGDDELKSEFDDDVAVFYGKVRVYVKRDAIYLFEKFSKIINDV